MQDGGFLHPVCQGDEAAPRGVGRYRRTVRGKGGDQPTAPARPGLNLLLRIARALHISLDALLYASPDPPIPEKRNLLCAVLALDEAETHFLWSVVWGLQRRRTQSE